MKKVTTLAILFATTIGCVATTSAQAPECPKMAQMKLTVDEYHLSLNDKKPICVSVPGTLKIRIHQPGNSNVSISAGDVTAGAKANTGLTIEGNNNAPINKLTIKVDGSADPGDEFAFWIEVKGVGMLDPKVRVVDSPTFRLFQSEELYDFLDTLDLTLEDANKLVPPRPEGAE